MLEANLQTHVDLPQDLTCIPEPQYLPAPSAPLDFVELGLSLSPWTQESRYVRTPRSFLSILASLALPIPPSVCHPILYMQAVPSLSLLSLSRASVSRQISTLPFCCLNNTKGPAPGLQPRVALTYLPCHHTGGLPAAVLSLPLTCSWFTFQWLRTAYWTECPLLNLAFKVLRTQALAFLSASSWTEPSETSTPYV